MQLLDNFTRRNSPRLEIQTERTLPLWKKRWFQLVGVALICMLASSIDAPPSKADTIPGTIPDPVQFPWLSELDCSDYFKILRQAQLNVFGDAEVVAALADDTFQIDDLEISAPDQLQTEVEPTATDDEAELSWILPEMNRQEDDLIRFPLKHDSILVPRLVTVTVGTEVINFWVEGSLLVTADSGIPQYESEMLRILTEQGKLIAGPKLKRGGSEAANCIIPDEENHRSLALATLYGEPDMALISPGEVLPVTHFEIGAIDRNKFSSWEAVINSILLAAELQAQVLNISIGGFAQPEIVEQLIRAMNYAKEKGVMIFVSAGNSNYSSMAEYMPACLYDEHIFRVLALQQGTDQVELWPSSNTYCANMTENSIAAPGYMVPALDRFGNKVLANGTSMAAPLASYIASLYAIGRDGQALPLTERITNFRARLVPPPMTANPNARRPDIYWRVRLNHCNDLYQACTYRQYLSQMSN